MFKTILSIILIANIVYSEYSEYSDYSGIIFPEKHQYFHKCHTIDGKKGICLRFEDCDNEEILKYPHFLRGLTCGHRKRRRRSIRICCPIREELIDKDYNSGDNSQLDLEKNILPEICGNRSLYQTFIVGGVTTEPGFWPWIAALFIEGIGFQCGATLITDQHVITAAHCVVYNRKVMDSSQFMIRLGEYNITAKTPDDAEEDYLVSKVIPHPDFNPKTLKNDIAIMRLKKKVEFNTRIFPICLPIDVKNRDFPDFGHIAGWGKVSFEGQTSDVLQEAALPIVPQNECQYAWRKSSFRISDEYLCAGTENSTIDSCFGDSGGPFMQSLNYDPNEDPNNVIMYLTGIVSFGRKCATPGYPSVYTRVTQYIDWILENLEEVDESPQNHSNSGENTYLDIEENKFPKVCGQKPISAKRGPIKVLIVGGEREIPGSWPWIAALFIEGIGFQCGATLITDQHVITAAHCVVYNGKVMDSSQLMIRLGEHNITAKTPDDAEEDYSVSKVIPHPEFNPKTLKNDIAIMRLKKKVAFNSRISPICLPFNKNITELTNSGQIAGWSRLAFGGKPSHVLQEATIFIVPEDECRKAWKTINLSEENFCAGNEDSSKDSCSGDSGGPFTQIGLNDSLSYLTGIVSFGKQCATPGYPGVYTRVSIYLDWISDNL